MPSRETQPGTGRTFLFVDGSPGGDQLTRLERHAPEGSRVISVLLADHGADDSPAATRADHEEHLARHVHGHGTGETVVVGYSYGAYLAARIAARPELAVDRAVLIGGFAGLTEPMVREREELARAAESGALSEADLVAASRSLFVSDPEDPALLSVADEIARSVPVTKLVRFVRRVNETGDARARVPPFETPACVLHDPDDAAIPYALGQELAALGSAAELVPLESGGHVGMVARPTRIAGHVFGDAQA
jgi:pimeloyl-ACP methyl ester carboxylesterase